MKRVMILEPRVSVRQQLSAWLEDTDYIAVSAPSVSDPSFDSSLAVAAIVANAELADQLLMSTPRIPVLLIASAPSIPAAVAAIKKGAANYLPENTSAAELRAALDEATASTAAATSFPMIGVSPLMRSLFDHIAKVAPTDSIVLIQGESGTGKELVARAMHAGSKRRLAPLISLNCAAIPSQLIESELFGHEDSSATGHRGLLEAAQGGTLFLDEISELPLGVQARLLQILEGTAGQARANIRLIAATQRDLEQLISTSQFRRDLYYRLNVVSLLIPPLRERTEDITLLAEDILKRTAARLGKPALNFSAEAADLLAHYHWPGNVRELENAIERAVILTDGGTITSAQLAIEPSKPKPAEVNSQTPEQTIEDYFVSFVTAHQDQLTETELAERLGISRKSLWERRQRLNIPRKKTRKRGPRRDIS